MDRIFNLLTWFLLTIMSPRFSIDEIKRLYVKVQFKLIILQYVRRGTIIILNMSEAAAWFKEGLTLDQILHTQNSLGSVAWGKVSSKASQKQIHIIFVLKINYRWLRQNYRQKSIKKSSIFCSSAQLLQLSNKFM